MPPSDDLKIIKDRRPAEADEDEYGYVWMEPASMSDRPYPYVAVCAAHVGPGVPWCHTDNWVEPQPDPEPVTYPKVPRLFAEPPRRTFSPSGAPQWDALADDGTAWKWSGTLEEWDQHKPLPDREEPTND